MALHGADNLGPRAAGRLAEIVLMYSGASHGGASSESHGVSSWQQGAGDACSVAAAGVSTRLGDGDVVGDRVEDPYDEDDVEDADADADAASSSGSRRPGARPPHRVLLLLTAAAGAGQIRQHYHAMHRAVSLQAEINSTVAAAWATASSSSSSSLSSSSTPGLAPEAREALAKARDDAAAHLSALRDSLPRDLHRAFWAQH